VLFAATTLDNGGADGSSIWGNVDRQLVVAESGM
jgi:hypothetical protein